MKVWIDIDNPPQVQYLAPFVAEFRRRGHEVRVTARDYGITHALLRDRGIAFEGVGGEFGASMRKKLVGTVGRAARAGRAGRRGGRPDLLLSVSRSAGMAAWASRLPAFCVVDYEHAELRSFRTFGFTVLHPSVIPAGAFTEAGFPATRLLAFDGLKEDLSLAHHDLRGAGHDFGVDRDKVTIVLVRPPSESSHYFASRSLDLTLALMGHLSADGAIQVVFSPRHPAQRSHVERFEWANPPIVLDHPIEFVALLKGVDWVVSAGGTMLREACYLGVPAVSTFQSRPGAVDRWLEAGGRLRFVEDPAEIAAVPWSRPPKLDLMPVRDELVSDLAGQMLARVEGGSPAA